MSGTEKIGSKLRHLNVAMLSYATARASMCIQLCTLAMATSLMRHPQGALRREATYPLPSIARNSLDIQERVNTNE